MTVEKTDQFIVSRASTNYRVEQQQLMAKLEDTDYMIVNRNGVDFRATGKDIKDSMAGPEIPPSVSGATLVGSGPGFAGETFTTQPQNYNTGYPVATEGLKAKVTGPLELVGETSPITGVTETVLQWQSTMTNGYTFSENDTVATRSSSNYGYIGLLESQGSIARGETKTFKFQEQQRSSYTFTTVSGFPSSGNNRGAMDGPGYGFRMNNSSINWYLNGSLVLSDSPAALAEPDDTITITISRSPDTLNGTQTWVVERLLAGDTQTYTFDDADPNPVFMAYSHNNGPTSCRAISSTVLELTDDTDLHNGLFEVGDQVTGYTGSEDEVVMDVVAVTGGLEEELRQNIEKAIVDTSGNYQEGDSCNVSLNESGKNLNPTKYCNYNAASLTLTATYDKPIPTTSKINLIGGSYSNQPIQVNFIVNYSDGSSDSINRNSGSNLWVWDNEFDTDGKSVSSWSMSATGYLVVHGMTVDGVPEFIASFAEVYTVTDISAEGVEPPTMTVSGGDWAIGKTVKNKVARYPKITPTSDEVVGVGKSPSVEWAGETLNASGGILANSKWIDVLPANASFCYSNSATNAPINVFDGDASTYMYWTGNGYSTGNVQSATLDLTDFDALFSAQVKATALSNSYFSYLYEFLDINKNPLGTPNKLANEADQNDTSVRDLVVPAGSRYFRVFYPDGSSVQRLRFYQLFINGVELINNQSTTGLQLASSADLPNFKGGMNVTQSGNGYTPETDTITSVEVLTNQTLLYAPNPDAGNPTADGTVIANGGTPLIYEIQPPNARLDYNGISVGWEPIFTSNEFSTAVYLTGGERTTVGEFAVDISNYGLITKAEVYQASAFPAPTYQPYFMVLRDADGNEVSDPINISTSAGWKTVTPYPGTTVKDVFLYTPGYSVNARARITAFRVNGSKFVLNGDEAADKTILQLSGDKDLENFRVGDLVEFGPGVGNYIEPPIFNDNGYEPFSGNAFAPVKAFDGQNTTTHCFPEQGGNWVWTFDMPVTDNIQMNIDVGDARSNECYINGTLLSDLIGNTSPGGIRTVTIPAASIGNNFNTLQIGYAANGATFCKLYSIKVDGVTLIDETEAGSSDLVYVTDIDSANNSMSVSGGTWSAGETVTAPLIPPATGVISGQPGNSQMYLSTSDGRWIVNGGLVVIGPEDTPATEVTSYLTWDSQNVIQRMVSTEQDFVDVTNLTLRFEDPGPGGIDWDVELPAGTRIATRFRARNNIATVTTGWTEAVTPRALRASDWYSELYAENAARMLTFDNRMRVMIGEEAMEEREDLRNHLKQAGIDLPAINKAIGGADS